MASSDRLNSSSACQERDNHVSHLFSLPAQQKPDCCLGKQLGYCSCV